MAAVTGNGEKDLAKKGNRVMVEPSENSVKKGKRNTGKTSKLTQGEALEILQSSLKMAQAAGIDVQIVPQFYANGNQYAGVLLANVEFVNGNLELITGKE